MQNLFCEGLLENDIVKLLEVPKSDIHNHSTKGCRRAWLEEHLKRSFPKPPDLLLQRYWRDAHKMGRRFCRSEEE